MANITIGSTVTDSPPLRGYKSARVPGVIGLRMFKPVLIIFISVLFIASCASPQKLESHYSEIGGKCIAVGKKMNSVEECIGVNFRESEYQGKIIKDHQSCKPYWGFPFMLSCGGLKIIYSQEKTVTKWFAWGQFDGI